MLLRKKLAVFVASTMLLVVSAASPAFAMHCTNVEKRAGAGSIGTYNFVTNTFTPAKEHGGFITITDGSTFSYDIFLHGTRPEGAMAAGPGGDSECDGVGIDDALACLGIDE